jgi:nucleoside-diphosphate-sugar epimerase
MALHVIVGKGPVGSATARVLRERGEQVRIVSRSGGDGPEHVALDATDAAALIRAAAGAAVVYNCANPAYHRWPVDWPPLAAALLDAAEATGAVLVTTGNLYGYGPVAGPITDDLPLAATGTKGRVRARMWTDALARHEAGRVRVTEARASDFYGPGVGDQSHLTRQLPAIRKGRMAWVLGDPDAPHSWTYVPDVARTLVRLGEDERAWGRAWHVPTAEPLSQREAIGRLCRAAGVDPVRVRQIPWAVVRAAGAAVPLLRELRETRHQVDAPFVLDSSRTTAVFGEEPTPLDDGFAATVGVEAAVAG